MHELADEHRVVVVGHSGVHGMELLGVRDMFEFATYLGDQSGQPPAYRVDVASVDGTPLDLGRGLTPGGVYRTGPAARPDRSHRPQPKISVAAPTSPGDRRANRGDRRELTPSGGRPE